MNTSIAMPDSCFTKNLRDLIEYIANSIVSKVLLKNNDTQCNLLCVARGKKITKHSSPRNATILVVEGSGNLNLEGRNITLAPGVFIFIPANVPQTMQSQENLAFILSFSENTRS